jgi:hypothetical protein
MNGVDAMTALGRAVGLNLRRVEPETPMTKIDPEPCPFCGSTNVIVRNTDEWGLRVLCWACLAEGPTGGATADDAAELWNDRHDAAVPIADGPGAIETLMVIDDEVN